MGIKGKSGKYKRTPDMKTGMHMIGRKLSAETRQRMRETHIRLDSGARLPKAKKGELPIACFTPEAKKNLSIAMLKRFEDKTKHPRWKGGKPKCYDCGKTLLSGYDRKRCSKCFHRYYSGERQWNWKGGITPEVVKERNRFKNEIQQKILKRDNYTCNMCGVKGHYLQVNHIKKWSDYPELRFDLDNCETLCMSCHYFKTYGRKMPLGLKWGYNIGGGEFRTR